MELWRYIRRLHGGRHDDPAHHALPRGGRGAVRGHRADPRRPPDRPRLRRRPARTLRRRLAGRRLRQGDGLVRGRQRPGPTPTAPRVSSLVVRHRGLLWLSAREILRVTKLWTQTIVAPVVSAVPVHRRVRAFAGRTDPRGDGVAYAVFIVPGLITMAMVQAAYSNNSSSVFQARFDRYLHDVLAAPMRPWEVNLGLSVGGAVRALAIGAAPVRAGAARHRRRRCATRSCWPRRSAWRWCCSARWA